MDETGTLSPQELVDGWFRLRGPAKAGAWGSLLHHNFFALAFIACLRLNGVGMQALDLAVLMADSNRMDAKLDWLCAMADL